MNLGEFSHAIGLNRRTVRHLHTEGKAFVERDTHGCEKVDPEHPLNAQLMRMSSNERAEFVK